MECCTPLLSNITLRSSAQFLLINSVFLAEEAEGEVSFEDLEERAKSGDAKAQTKVSVNFLQNY